MSMNGRFAPEAALGGLETPTSALLPKADSTRKSWQVRNVPTADMPFMPSYISSIQREAELH
jgi:hypothetical protein